MDTDRRGNVVRRGEFSLVLPGSAAPLAPVVLLVFIWALSGAGYFWPMWPAAALLMVTGIIAADTLRAALGVIVGFLIAIWAMSGFGYFWPAWPMLGLLAAYGISRAAGGRREQVLEERVDELSRTRRGALDSQATELRRIERDLHDGAQARLVALSMKLGRAEERFRHTDGGEDVSAFLREAREDASAAIRELRELARGIAPPVLADRGLEAAVTSLADRTGAKVTVAGMLTRRPTPAVEIAAYFVVAESLTNAAKHAPGAPVEVRLSEHGGDLFVEITDFGPGGANVDGGGLTGLRQRVEALDGRLSVTSPQDVGTQVEAVLPCGW